MTDGPGMKEKADGKGLDKELYQEFMRNKLGSEK